MTTPTRVGYASTQIAGNSVILTPDPTIQTGHWMIASVMFSAAGVVVTPPAGWSELYQAISGIGTRSYAVFGKIRQAGESTYTFTTSASGNKTASLMWGANSKGVNNWVVGAPGTRLLTGTATTTVAPSINAPADTLVVALSAEATTATETSITSLAGATSWYWVGHNPSPVIIETLSVSYIEKNTAGATGTVTTTYPNSQPSNGVAIQIGIPLDAVPNVAPTASFTTTNNGFEITFAGASSVDTDGSIVSYDWNFGDGKTGTGASTVHTYSSAGIYTATLVVKDDDGATASITKDVVVAGKPIGFWDGTMELPLALTGWNPISNSAQFNLDYTPGNYKRSDLIPPYFIAHRGGAQNWPELSARAYRNSAIYGFKALEVSAHKTSDGVWVASHDANTLRVTGTSKVIANTTWAEINDLTISAAATDVPTQPRQPFAKLVDILNTYASSHVIFIEDKTYTHTTELLDLLDTYPGSHDHFVWKVAGNSVASPAAAMARGYSTWGYFFDNDMVNFADWHTKFSYVGLDYHSTDATLTTAIALAGSTRCIGHILETKEQKDRMLALGCTGIMVTNPRAVLPKN